MHVSMRARVCEREREREMEREGGRERSDRAHTQHCQREDNPSGTPTGDGDVIQKIFHMKMNLPLGHSHEALNC
jgi:hypothetical protein